MSPGKSLLSFNSSEYSNRVWSRGRMLAYGAEGGGSTAMGNPRIFNIVFHQQKLSSLSIACDIKLKGALYSVFYAETSKRSWTSLYEYGMCQTPILIISSLRLPLASDQYHQDKYSLAIPYTCRDVQHRALSTRHPLALHHMRSAGYSVSADESHF